MATVRDNLRPRLRLLRTALTRRFIYHDLIRMVKEYGLDYSDVTGDVGSIDLVRALGIGDLDSEPSFGERLRAEDQTAPSGAPAKFNSEPSVARFLGQLVFHSRARTVIELGCFVGWTTAHIALALEGLGDGRVFCVDPVAEYIAAMHTNLERLGLGGFATSVCGYSMDPVVLQALPGCADVIFLDTSHSYPATRDEILAYEPRMAAGGCFVLHDSTSAPGVRRSLQDLAGRFHVHTFATERSNGVTVLMRRPQ